MSQPLRVLLLIAGLSAAPTGSAAEMSGWRNILEYGCHRGDGTCYVTIDGAPVTGAAGCVGNSVRWDSKNDVGGKNWLALIMFAKATGKRVNFQIDGCYSLQPMFPTFGYGIVEP